MARTRWTPGWSSLVCLVLGFSGAACSRGSSGPEREAPSASAAASAAAAPSASHPRRRERSRSVTAPPAASPKVAPQLVACVGRSFYRITRKSLQAFEASERIPPPQIRGSATARQLADVEISEPLNLITLGPTERRVLVLGKREVIQYEAGQKTARVVAPNNTPGPLVAWPDPGNADAFGVHVHGERIVHHKKLGPGASSTREQALDGFDQRLFAVLADGVPFYSTPEGLLGPPVSRPIPFPVPQKPATVLFADSSRGRYWAADALGNLGLWDMTQDKPVFSARVPGVVIDAAHDADRVGVLSMELDGQHYRPTVTIFSNGEQQGQLTVGPSLAYLGQPELDLCLIAGRPWVVVGGKDWMHLLDWKARRLLAEW